MRYFKSILIVSLLILSACGTRRRISVSNPTTVLVPYPKPVADNRDSILNARKKHESNTKIVSLLLPFRLNQMSTKSRTEIERSALSLDFYQGIKIALDSLSLQNKGLQLNVFDTRDDSTHVSEILDKSDLSKSKLIIGPIYPSEIHRITEFAKKTHTWFVSPLSPQALSNYHNPYLIMVNCPIEAYAKKTALFIKDNYPDSKVILVHNSESDEKFLIPLKESLVNNSQDISIRGNMGLDAIKQALSSEKKNILIIPSLDKIFWARLMIYLSPMSSSKLTVIAHPGFERMHFNNIELLQSLDLHFASNYFLDRNSSAFQNFARKYKAKWFTQPNEYAFIGYDIGMYFGNAVIKEEEISNYLHGSTFQGLANNMEFQEVAGSGYWNQSVKMLSYGQGQLVEVK